MNAMQELRQEHEAVKLTLRVLDRMCQEIERSGKPGDPQHVEHLLEFFTVFVDKCHHGKEDEPKNSSPRRNWPSCSRGLKRSSSKKSAPASTRSSTKCLTSWEIST